MVIFILVRLWGTFMALRKYSYFFLTVWESIFFLLKGGKGDKTERNLSISLICTTKS